MEDPQEFKSVDELFRRTFEDLPDTPAESGWDTPSPAVWEHVQKHLAPPATGWSGKAILLLGGFALVLMLGLYWALSRPNTAETDTPAPVDPGAVAHAPRQTETTAPLPEENAEQRANPSGSEQPAVERTATASLPEIPGAEYTPPRVVTPPSHEEEGLRRIPAESAPLPGTLQASPTTTIRRQVEAFRRAPWAQPMRLLPGYRDAKIIRPVPESLKNLSKKQ